MFIKLSISYQIRKYAIALGLLLAFFAAMTIINQALAASEPVSAGDGESLVVIHDRGVAKTIVTKARTVREALNAADIEIHEHQDVVEPNLDASIDTKKYNINIYRARPVVVIDGAERSVVTTAHQTSELIAQAAGIEVYKEDAIELENPESLAVDGGSVIMRIDRAAEVTLVLYGKETTVRTRADSVKQLLQEKNITLGRDDVLSLDQHSPVQPGMRIELWRNGKQTVTVEEAVAFETEQVQDAGKEVGYREVTQVGENGIRNVTYEIEMRNGQEVARREIASVVAKEPKKQIEIIGIKLNLPAGSHTDWMAAAGIAESDYGYANYLVTKESGWRVNAKNASSGAYGLPQALPGSKMASAGSDWQTNPITQLRWMNGYVMGRYGSWANAVKHSKENGWY